MSNEMRQLVLNTISILDNADKTQIEINQLWMEIKSLIKNEMDSLPNISSSNCKKNEPKIEKRAQILE